MDRGSEISKRVQLLQLAGARDRQQSGHGDFAVETPRAEHDLPPLHGRAKRAFGSVVRRFDALLVHEVKKCGRWKKSARARFRTSAFCALT